MRELRRFTLPSPGLNRKKMRHDRKLMEFTGRGLKLYATSTPISWILTCRDGGFSRFHSKSSGSMLVLLLTFKDSDDGS